MIIDFIFCLGCGRAVKIKDLGNKDLQLCKDCQAVKDKEGFKQADLLI